MKKDKYQRTSEVILVLKKIKEMQINLNLPEIVELQDILKSWLNDGIYKFGEIYINNSDRKIVYKLFDQTNKEILVKFSKK